MSEKVLMSVNKAVLSPIRAVMAGLALLSSTTLHANTLWDWTPTNLTTWADFDGAVSNTYAGFTSVVQIFPPGPWHFGLGSGYVTFSPDGELAALTNLCPCSTQYNVPVWRMTVCETQTTPRAWLYIGSAGVPFRTNECPSSYDPRQWVRDVYGHDAPGYLTGTNLDRWYNDRDRSRFTLSSTFVSSNDWPTLRAAQWAAATNAPALGSPPPTMPADTNNMSFSNILSPLQGAMDLWIYTPSARPVAVLMSTNLTVKGWSLLGRFGSTPPFNLWHASSRDTAFFRTGYTDIDSDGDGIPDAIESLVLGTDPDYYDTVGSSLGDYCRLMIYGLDSLALDSNGDGIPDAWAIANGFDPLDSSVGDQDTDGDGICNRVEYLLGTNPRKTSTLDAANPEDLRTATPLRR